MYETVALVALALTLLNKYRGNLFSVKLNYTLIYIMICLVDGLRWRMGVDWDSYYSFYQKIDSFNIADFELFFYIYTYAFKKLFDSYPLFIFINAVTVYGMIFYSIYKITRSTLAIFYIVSIIPWYSGSMRQFIAIGFVCLSLKYFYFSKPIKSIFIAIIATLFHYTALPFAIFPFVKYLRLSSIYIIIFVLSIIVFFYAEDILILMETFSSLMGSPKQFAQRFGGTYEEARPFYGTIRKLFNISFLLTILYLYNNESKIFDLKNHKNISYFYVLLICSLPIYLIGVFKIAQLASRFDLYFSVVGISIIIGLLDNLSKNYLIKILLLLFTCYLSLFFYGTIIDMDLFHPYTSLFYNEDYYRELH